MKLVDMTCPHCGGTLKINPSEKMYVCDYCGSKLVLDNETLHIQFDNAEESGYQFEKGRQRAQAEANRNQSTQHSSTYQKPQKKRTWLWVLGWIFIFPVPLTILMLRNKALDKKIKYVIIAVAWIVYLIIGMSGRSDNKNNNNNNNTMDSSVSTTSPLNQATTTDNGSEESTNIAITEKDSPDNQEDIINENNSETSSKLNDFLLALNADVSKKDIEGLSKNYDLFSGGKNSNTGHYTYRFSEVKDVADAFKAEKGSVITVTYDLLHNDEMEEITYFDESRMVAGFWTPDTGYTMTDYNNPQITSDSGSARIPVSSFKELIDYVPEMPTTDNLLEELFLFVSDTTTKADVLDFVDSHNLVYDSRGKGNEQMIAYTADVIKKYGDSGSCISFTCDSNDVITSMSYYEYPYNYRTGYSAVYYSSDYSYSDLVGYYLYQYKEEPIKFDSARSLIDEINSNR